MDRAALHDSLRRGKRGAAYCRAGWEARRCVTLNGAVKCFAVLGSGVLYNNVRFLEALAITAPTLITESDGILRAVQMVASSLLFWWPRFFHPGFREARARVLLRLLLL